MTERISGDATLADVIQTPEDYLCAVLRHLHRCRKENGGNLVLRIGITGRGIVPHYRIDEHSRWKLFDNEENDNFAAVAAFNGRNHEPLVTEGEEPELLHDHNWSTRAMTFDEVKALLGSLRGIKR